ncbi:MAG: SDR family oxidoreductase [Planctomycetes bacterium]|nr:SDR family oxidoreductase [Planctomycetota bacterium]
MALVTGAGRGLGTHLALALASEGYDLLAHYRTSEAGARAVAQRARELGRRAAVLGADLARPEGARALRDALLSEFGRLDVLVNNAGAFVHAPVLELTAEEWNEALASTAGATCHVTAALLPLLRAAGAGRVVNIADATAERTRVVERTLPYAIGKAGVVLLTRAFARAEAPHGVTVNAIGPGILAESRERPPISAVPAGRYGTPDDVVAVLRFLISPEAGYVTGAFIPVAGGWGL